MTEKEQVERQGRMLVVMGGTLTGSGIGIILFGGLTFISPSIAIGLIIAGVTSTMAGFI